MFDDEYDDGNNFKQRPIRCCERCGDGDNMERPEPMLAEVHLAFGVVCWICFNCRKDWHRMFKEHPQSKVYTHAQIKMELWKTRCDLGKIDKPDEGIKLMDEIEDIEIEINQLANAWLIGTVDEIRSN